ncbi:hypothetical protein [Streptomyces sp.]|uniref:hypothetical protein n=1 Tax=Streptomyces sp. TaxID=1931 RepID=UPI002D775C8B|nr:hypothetical protein [Streptomyces sp.]HET6354621.1 hypothetical protein [Streptomyces sp.]
MLRRWLDTAGLKIEDLRGTLSPDHFTNQAVPSRTTVSERLAGVNLQWDFVEAVADACSDSNETSSRLLSEARSLLDRISSATPPAQSEGRQSAAAAKSPQNMATKEAAELVAAQRHSLALSDKLLRAMERSAELEQARNNANHMVLILLTMVDKLRRDVATLTGERERMQTARKVQEDQSPLRGVRERLERSESQRAAAETELARAHTEREKADRLAEQAAEQVRVLTEELDRLRGGHSDALHAEPSQLAPIVTVSDASTDDTDDIDLALFRASQVLDGEADRLDHLADELKQDAPNWDNSLIRQDASDISPDNFMGPGSQTRPRESSGVFLELFGASPEELEVTGHPAHEVASRFGLAQAHDSVGKLLDAAARNGTTDEVLLLSKSLRPEDLYSLLAMIGAARPAKPLRELITAFRASGRDSEADKVLAAVGRHRPVRELPLVLSSLRGVEVWDIEWILETVMRNRTTEMAAIIRRLQETGLIQEANWLQLRSEMRGLTTETQAPPPDSKESATDADSKLTTRIRINIPASRPLPPAPAQPPRSAPSSDWFGPRRPQADEHDHRWPNF